MLTAASPLLANDYQVFTGLQYQDASYNGHSTDYWRLDAAYFFDKRTALGPFDQFKYINNISHVGASFSHLNSNYWSVGGEYFTGNNFAFSGSYNRSSNSYVTTASIGYLFTDDFIVRAHAQKPKSGSTTYMFSANYNWQLNDNDYIGFAANTDDEFDNYGFGARYFSSLGGEHYLTIGADYTRHEHGDDFWALSVGFYFSQQTSISALYDENDNYRVAAKHFLNRNWAISAGYGSNTDDSEVDVWTLGITGQF